MKKNSPYLFILIFINCSTYFFLPEKAKISESRKTLKNTKIALIGFCAPLNPSFRIRMNMEKNLQLFFVKEKSTFDQEFINRHRNGLSNHSSAYIALCPNDFKENLGLGSRPLSEYPSNGLEENISNEKIISFIQSYLDKTRMGGQTDILEMFEVKNTRKLKQRELDYYVVGVLQPATERANILSILNYFLSFGTLFIVPYFVNDGVDSIFFVYDNKLNLLKKFEYNSEFLTMSSSWVSLLPISWTTA